MNNEAYIEKMNIHWNNFLEECKTNSIVKHMDFNQWYNDKLRFLKTPDEIDAFINHPKPLDMNNEASNTEESNFVFGEPKAGIVFFDSEGKYLGGVMQSEINKPSHTGDIPNQSGYMCSCDKDRTAPRIWNHLPGCPLYVDPSLLVHEAPWPIDIMGIKVWEDKSMPDNEFKVLSKEEWDAAIKKFYQTPLQFEYSWQRQVDNYCKEAGISPDQLVEQHKYWAKMAHDQMAEAIKDASNK